ncbi:nucleolin 1-like [Senna tora]|uniref:Nucleolin 1-like n=1 Tax=Senna tora TaxID=362788 RepID=A0A834T8I4_9FABA|nr:nucleolin 1-like [Senna tora]
MELLVGPAFTIDVSSPTYSGDHHTREKEEQHTAVPSCLFLSEADRRSDDHCGSDFRIGGRSELSGYSSESSSSIGTPDDESGDDEEEEYEVQSKLNGGLGLDSLDDSLPNKRGLSGHFNGKSKSFTDLSQVSCVKELQKQENPFNKRRRLIMASKWSRRSSFYTWSNPKSMPLLPLHEQEEQVVEEEDKQEDQLLQMPLSRVPDSYAAKMRLRLGNFNLRSFSLADLQEHDEQEEDD